MNAIDRVNQLVRQKRYKSALSQLKKLTRGSNPFWALKMSGMVCREMGELPDSAIWLDKALSIQPDDVEANLFMAAVKHESGSGVAAVPYLQKVCLHDNNNYHALRLLSLISLDEKNYTDALHYTEVLSRAWADAPESQLLRGQALLNAGDPGAAVICFDRVISLSPARHEGYFCRARALKTLGRLDEAIASYQQAARQADMATGPALELAGLFEQARMVKEASQLYQTLLKRFPEDTDVLNSAANYYIKLFRSHDAVVLLERSIKIDPCQVSAYVTLANAYKSMGMLDKYRECISTAMEIKAADPAFFSAYLLNLNYFPEISNLTLFDEHRKWDQMFYSKASCYVHDAHDRGNKRKLRIGYISADFKNHAVYYFIEPILANHDKNKFEVFCYYNDLLEDEVTRRFQSYADAWHSIYSLSDDEVAGQIYNDKIDILIDLSGHTAGNRLQAIAKKPAPIQVEYEAYPNTTGMVSIDYKLTDDCLDGENDKRFHTETLVSLGDCFICYQPNPEAPEISEPPILNNSYVTFGSFSNLYKLNERVIDLWCRILHRIPNSRLMIFRLSINDDAKVFFQRQFESRGITADRLIFVGAIPEHYMVLPADTRCMAVMSECDFILDTFPYCNHTIACEALWMGVPIITLYGERHASRVCSTILNAIGHPELIANTEEDYLNKATELSSDSKRIAELRHQLRDDFRNSVLMDFRSFTLNIERVYEELWAGYCQENYDKCGSGR